MKSHTQLQKCCDFSYKYTCGHSREKFLGCCHHQNLPMMSLCDMILYSSHTLHEVKAAIGPAYLSRLTNGVF